VTEEEKTRYASDGAEKWTDLEAAYIKDPELAKRIQRMSKNYRTPPKYDQQMDLFVPAISDVSSKDDISLMDIAVFGLGKKPRFEAIEYDLKDAHITVQGGVKSGMATIFDYDIFLYMVSYLTREMERCKEKVKGGEDAHLPPRKIKPPVSDLLKFCRRGDGGKQYKQIEAALERLKSTVISIKKKDGSSRRAGFFNLIGDVKIASETKTGRVSEVIISIPDWVYDGVVRVGNPAVLTLDPDYFLLDQGYHRFLHRLARKAAGKGQATYNIETLYERSGTNRPIRSFKPDIKRAIKDLEKNPLPDYSVIYEKKGRKEHIIFTYTGEREE